MAERLPALHLELLEICEEQLCLWWFYLELYNRCPSCSSCNFLFLDCFDYQYRLSSVTFFCLCFGLGSAPQIFTKLLGISISPLIKINIRVKIYLDDMFIVSHTIKEAQMSRDTVIYLLQNWGFIINIMKSILHTLQKIEFFRMEISK